MKDSLPITISIFLLDMLLIYIEKKRSGGGGEFGNVSKFSEAANIGDFHRKAFLKISKIHRKTSEPESRFLLSCRLGPETLLKKSL